MSWKERATPVSDGWKSRATPIQAQGDYLDAIPVEELKQAVPSGRGLLKGAIKTIPYVTAGVGGFLGGGPTPTGIAGGALGYAGGKSIENFLLAAMDDPEAPQTRAEIARRALVSIPEGVANEMGGQLIGKAVDVGAPAVSKWVGQNVLKRKSNADAIEAAAGRLGTKPTPAMTSEGYITQGLEDSLQRSPTVTGSLVRSEVGKTRKAMQDQASAVLGKGSSLDRYQAGEAIKNKITESTKGSLEKIGEKYKVLEESFPFIDATDRQIKGTIKRITEHPELKTDAMGTLSNYASKISENLKNLKSASDINKLKSYVGSLKAADSNEAKFLSDTYKALDNLVQNSVKNQAKSLGRMTGDKVFQEEAKQLLKTRSSANRAYRGQMKNLEELGEQVGVKISRRDTPKRIMEKIEGIKGENLQKKIFNPQDQRTMNFFAEKYPELFGIAKGSELGYLGKKATKDSQIDLGTFFTNIKNMPEAVKQKLFGKDYGTVKDLQTLYEARPPVMNPSGTASGIEWQRYLSPVTGFGLVPEAGRLAQYGLYKGADKLAKSVDDMALAGKGLLENTPSAGSVRQYLGENVAAPLVESQIPNNEQRDARQDELISKAEDAINNPNSEYALLKHGNDVLKTAMAIDMLEGYLKGGFMGSIGKLPSNVVNMEKNLFRKGFLKPSLENQQAQNALDNLAKATDPKDIEGLGFLAKQKMEKAIPKATAEIHDMGDILDDYHSNKPKRNTVNQSNPDTEGAMDRLMKAKKGLLSSGETVGPIKSQNKDQPVNFIKEKLDRISSDSELDETLDRMHDLQNKKQKNRIKPGKLKEAKPIKKMDAFDAAFERVKDRFGDNPPKNLKRAEAINKAGGHDEPYAFGDIHSIQWSKGRLEKGDKGEFNRPMPFPTRVKDLKGVLGKGVPDGSGPDPFMWMDTKYGSTKKALVDNFDKPLQIHTRSDLIANNDYMEHLNPTKHVINIHLPPSTNEYIARILEPGAPSVKRRISAAKKLKEAGYKVNLVHDDIMDNFGSKISQWPKDVQENFEIFKNNFVGQELALKREFPDFKGIKLKKNPVKIDKRTAKELGQSLGWDFTQYLND